MATLSRFSTSTVFGSEGLVPWLAAQGPLAYSPEEPPATDYFFQYSWILPGIFGPKVNLREHRYFGNRLKNSARFLFNFWGNVRKGNAPALQQYSQLGAFSDNELKAPIAAYRHVRKLYDTAGPLRNPHAPYQCHSRQHQANNARRERPPLPGVPTDTALSSVAVPPGRLPPVT